MSYAAMVAAYERAVRANVGALPAPVQRLSDPTLAKLFSPQAWGALVGDHLWVEPAPCGPPPRADDPLPRADGPPPRADSQE